MVDFLSASQKSLGTGLNTPYGVTADAAGNLYVANSGHDEVEEILAAGGYSTAKKLGGRFSFPDGVAVDGAGNVFVADFDHGAVDEIPPGCTTASCVVILGNSFFGPAAVAVDGSDNVYVADGSSVYEMLAASGYTTVNELGAGYFSFPVGVAVDASGNVFVADNDAGISEILAAGGYTTVNSLGGSFSFAAPGGVALDASGNVYVADAGTDSGEPDNTNFAIYEITVADGYNTVNTLSQPLSPEGVALDGSGNIYVVGDNSTNVLEIDRADVPALKFNATLVSTLSSDSPIMLTAENNGNLPLTIDAPIIGTNPNITGTGFTLASGSGSDCTLVPVGPTPGMLAAGASCVLPVSFMPPTEGAFTGALTLQDNTLNVDGTTQSISLSGIGGDAITVTVGTAITGLTFSVDGSSSSSPQTFNWITGDQHTLSTSVQTSSDGETEYTPTGWNTDTTATDTITVTTGVTSYTASYSLSYLLLVTPNNGGLGTVTPATATFETAGAPASISATSTGGSFIGWTGSPDITNAANASTTITMTGPEFITANFVPYVSGTSGFVSFGSQAINSTSAPQAVSVNILAGASVGSIAVFTMGYQNFDFALASPGGTCTTTSYSSPASCTVNVTFAPLAAGLRQGAVVFFSGAGNTGAIVGNVPIYGNGTGPEIAHSPAPLVTLPHSHVTSPYGVATDVAGDVFIANFGSGPGNGSVVEVQEAALASRWVRDGRIPVALRWTGPEICS